MDVAGYLPRLLSHSDKVIVPPFFGVYFKTGVELSLLDVVRVTSICEVFDGSIGGTGLVLIAETGFLFSFIISLIEDRIEGATTLVIKFGSSVRDFM